MGWKQNLLHGRGEGEKGISSREDLMSKIGFKQPKAVSTRTVTRDPGLVGCASCQAMLDASWRSSRELKIF